MTKVMEARAVVSATDATGGVFDQIANKIRRINAAAKAVSGAAAPIAAMSQKVEASGRKMVAFGTRASIAAALPAAFAAKRGYDTVLQYEKKLNEAQAMGELTAEQAKIVDRDARKLGATTQFSATQALEMISTYIKAGRTFEQARGMAGPTLDFALLGDGINPKKAADTITAIASAYRLAMDDVVSAQKQARYVGDLVAKTAASSKADVMDVAQGFKYAAPMAKIAGVQMEELAGAIATMTNNGQRGDEAGVALRSMLVRMVAPTSKARAAMAELNLQFDQFSQQRPIDSGGLIRSLEQSGISARNHKAAIDQIIGSAAYKGARGDMIPALTDAIIKGSDIDSPENREKIADAVGAYLLANTERLNMPGLVKALMEKQASAGQLARIFDQRQGSRIATLLTPDFFKNTDTMRREASGFTEKGARIMEQGVYGAHQRLLSSTENLVLTLAKTGVIDNVSKTIDALASGLNRISETSPKVLELATYAGMATAALGPLAIIVGKLATAAGAIGGLFGAGSAAAGGVAGAAGGAATSSVTARSMTVPWLAAAIQQATQADLLTKAPTGQSWREIMLERGHRNADGSFKPLTIDAVQQAIGNANVTAKLEGAADVNVKVTVEPSPDFLTRIKNQISNAIGNLRINGGIPEKGTAGSTGKSMPEAAPAP
jgi:hypothetical protein